MGCPFDQLKVQGAGWLALSRQVEYLNEISLRPKELVALLEHMHEWRNLLSTTAETRFALAVAAVNWACYQEDDEGFRRSFTERLLGAFDERAWADQLGAPIEAAITGWGGIAPRQGAYRYVGLIREQAGLCHHHLDRFASLLSSLQEAPGWPAVQTVDDEVLQDVVRRHFCDTCSARYLCSVSGLAFIRAVSRDLASYYERALVSIEELDSARGYRPRLMSSIVQALDRKKDTPPPARRRSEPRWSDPSLVLSENGRLHLQFDVGEVSRRLIRCRQYGSSIYSAHVAIGAELPARDQYTGTRVTLSGQEEWTAKGWCPKGRDWALFDASRQLVCTSSRPGRVLPDSYFLVIDSAVGVDQKTVTAQLGWLDLDEVAPETTYAIYSVDLATGQGPPGLDVIAGASLFKPLFEVDVDDTECWGRYAGIDAVWSLARPLVRLRNWTEENSRRFVVVVQVGDQAPSPLLVPPAHDGVASIDLSDRPNPSLGRIWLEPKGRISSGAHLSSQLSFARWPACTIRPPEGLWPADAEPVCHIALDPAVECEVIDDGTVKRASNGFYHVQAYAGAARLRLTCHGVGLNLRLPVYRARLARKESPDSQLYLSPNCLRPGSYVGQELPAPLLLTALPRIQMDLVLREWGTARCPLVAQRNIGVSGSCTVQLNELADAVRASGIGLGRFEVIQGGATAETAAWYIDPDHLGGAESATTTGLPSPLADAIGGVRAVQRGEVVEVARVSDLLPVDIQQWVARWLWAAKVLDGWSVTDRVRLQMDEATSNTLDGLSRLLEQEEELASDKDAVPKAELLLETWDRFDPPTALRGLGLDIERWQNVLGVKRSHVCRIADVKQRAAAVAEAIRQNTSVPEVPKRLSTAWRSYLLAGEYKEKPKVAKEYLKDACACIQADEGQWALPWSAIGQVLLQLCYLRLGLIRTFLRDLEKQQPPSHAVLAWAQLRCIAANLRMRRTPIVTNDQCGLTALSPRDDDGALVAGLTGSIAQWRSVASNCWIGAWLGWRWTHLEERPSEEEKTMYDLLLSRMDTIPAGANRDDVIYEIRARKPGEWP